MSKARIHDRLVNFGRAWRDYHGDFLRIGSLESKYLRQFDDDAKSYLAAERAQEEQAAKPDPIDLRDAILVHDAWKKCSMTTKKLLKFSFCFGRVTDKFICQRCGIREDQLPLKFAHAVSEIRQMLDESSVARTIPAQKTSNRPDKAHPSDSDEPARYGAANSKVAASPKESENID